MRIRIRILFLIKLMRVCYHWSEDPPRPHFEPSYTSIVSVYGHPLLQLDPPLVLNFDFDADPGPAFDFAADPYMDPDPASQNDADSCRCASATLLSRQTLRFLYCLLHYVFSLLYVISVLVVSHDHRAVKAWKILFSNYYSLAGHLLIPLLGIVCFDTCCGIPIRHFFSQSRRLLTKIFKSVETVNEKFRCL